jgi:PBP1b-binding outer membrane lipoprotein LpoB
MKRVQKSTGVFAILAFGLILVGCSSNAAQTQPTQDVSVIQTQAVQTAVAQITIDAALNVTPTSPATATAEATEAPLATATLQSPP